MDLEIAQILELVNKILHYKKRDLRTKSRAIVRTRDNSYSHESKLESKSYPLEPCFKEENIRKIDLYWFPFSFWRPKTQLIGRYDLKCT